MNNLDFNNIIDLIDNKIKLLKENSVSLIGRWTWYFIDLIMNKMVKLFFHIVEYIFIYAVPTLGIVGISIHLVYYGSYVAEVFGLMMISVILAAFFVAVVGTIKGMPLQVDGTSESASATNCDEVAADVENATHVQEVATSRMSLTKLFLGFVNFIVTIPHYIQYIFSTSQSYVNRNAYYLFFLFGGWACAIYSHVKFYGIPESNFAIDFNGRIFIFILNDIPGTIIYIKILFSDSIDYLVDFSTNLLRVNYWKGGG